MQSKDRASGQGGIRLPEFGKFKPQPVVGKDEVVYDLGSGDGRIVIEAVRDFGARRAVGIEIDPELVATSRDKSHRKRACRFVGRSSAVRRIRTGSILLPIPADVRWVRFR